MVASHGIEKKEQFKQISEDAIGHWYVENVLS
jgi:hypothetical protein